MLESAPDRSLSTLRQGYCPSADELDTTHRWAPGLARRTPRDPDRGKQSFALLVPECRAVALWRNSDTLISTVGTGHSRSRVWPTALFPTDEVQAL